MDVDKTASKTEKENEDETDEESEEQLPLLNEWSSDPKIWKGDAITINVEMDTKTMIEIIESENDLSFRNILKNYNSWLRKTRSPPIKSRYITRVQVMEVIVKNICPGCLEDGCQSECDACYRWYCADCVGIPEEGWLCNFCEMGLE